MTATLHSPAIVTDPFMAYSQAAKGTTVGLPAANDIAIYAFNLPYPMEVSEIGVFIGVGDNSNNSDIGIYDASGNLLGHIGAQHISSANADSFSLTGGPIVIGPGLYFLAFTSAGTTLMWAVGTDGNNYALGLHSTSSTSSGGALPSTISITVGIDEGQPSPFQGYPPVMILM